MPTLGELLPMRRLDPAYRACFADGSTINVRYGREAMREEIAQTCGSVDAAAFDEFVDWLRQLYLIEMPNFIDRNYDSPLGLLSSPRALAQLVRLGAFGRLGAAVRKRFADPRLHRLFSFQAMYAGLSPDSALALYAVITYMDTIEGVWFPEGGMHAVPTIMAQVAEKAGVTFRYGDAVETVLRSPTGRVAGVQTTSGERIMADAVVCTLDLPTAYQQLLGDLRPPRAVRRGRLLALCSGLARRRTRSSRTPPIAHHNIHFGEEWSSSFDALQAGPANARPVAAGHHPLTRRPHNGPELAAPRCTSWNPCPTSTARSTGRPKPSRCADRMHTFLAQQRYPTDVITEELVTPARLADSGNGCRHALRACPHVRADRTVPSAERRAAAAWDVLRRIGDGSRSRRSHGAHLGQARGQPSRRIPSGARPVSDWISYEALLTEGYRRCARLTWRYGTTYFWGAVLLPKPQRKHVYAIYALCRLADDIVDLPNGQHPIVLSRTSMPD